MAIYFIKIEIAKRARQATISKIKSTISSFFFKSFILQNEWQIKKGFILQMEYLKVGKRNIYNIIFFIGSMIYLARCTINHTNTPTIEVNFKNRTVLSINKNFYIDSIAFENYELSQPIYSIKARSNVNLKDSIALPLIKDKYYVIKGKYDSICLLKDIRILIYLKSKDFSKSFYSSAYYKCNSDSVIFIKTMGEL